MSLGIKTYKLRIIHKGSFKDYKDLLISEAVIIISRNIENPDFITAELTNPNNESPLQWTRPNAAF